jgi:Predicted membrane protein (DUF2207)
VRRLRSWVLAAVAVAGAAAGAGAAPRDLHWKSLDVEARLDRDGVLHVRERQHLVMTGDWNGGERGFRIEPTQDLELQGMRRLDPVTGAVHAMREGGLQNVDEYGWTSWNVLRWRSRLPSDPEFDRTELVYELDYTLHGALQPADEAFVLAHDFAFADRTAAIESFTVQLSIDPSWEVDGPRERRIEAGRLVPGAGYVVRVGLRPAGAAVVWHAPRRQRLLLALWLAPMLLLVQLFVSEWRRGRFARLDPDGAAQALDAHLLAHPAEVVGAVWDRAVGPDEVGALIARLAAEGTLRTTVDHHALSMKLLVDRRKLSGYERALVDGFFFGGRDRTSTDEVRKRYQKTGFDPVRLVRSGIEARADALVGPAAPAVVPLWLPSALCAAGGLYAVWSAGGPIDHRVVGLLLVLVPLLIAGGIGLAAALGWRRRVDRGLPEAARFVVPIALMVGFAAEAMLGFGHLKILDGLVAWTGGFAPARQLGAVLLAFACVNEVVNGARSRERREGMAVRKRLASARRYFETEFQKTQPALRDEWFPYVLALGLDADSRRWFSRFGGASAGVSEGSRSTSGRSSPSGGSSWSDASSSGSSAGSPTGWTGGGGAFGGAGATASWSAAAGAMSAAVVAAPSSGVSDGSGGGGGGGDSSSGGGSGGGW